jgi:hypothetical protein
MLSPRWDHPPAGPAPVARIARPDTPGGHTRKRPAS